MPIKFNGKPKTALDLLQQNAMVHASRRARCRVYRANRNVRRDIPNMLNPDVHRRYAGRISSLHSRAPRTEINFFIHVSSFCRRRSSVGRRCRRHNNGRQKQYQSRHQRSELGGARGLCAAILMNP